MRKIAAVAMICLWAAALAPAESTARLSEMRAARGVDPKLQSPVGVSETFGPEAKPIYLTVKLSDAPPGTQVKITTYFLQNGQPQQIAVQEFPDVNGTGYLSSKITPPASGLVHRPLQGRFPAEPQGARHHRLHRGTGQGGSRRHLPATGRSPARTTVFPSNTRPHGSKGKRGKQAWSACSWPMLTTAPCPA